MRNGDYIIPQELIYILNELNIDINAVNKMSSEEEFWEEYLSSVPDNDLNDVLLNYLYKKGYCAILLAHKRLPDKWLEKYSFYDDQAIYTLMERRYCQDNYTYSDFINTFIKYIDFQCNISIHLLEHKQSSKRRLLIYLLQVSNRPDLNDIGLRYALFDLSLCETNQTKLNELYQTYKDNRLVLLGLSQNIFLPYNILEYISHVTGMPSARKIRKYSLETMKKKKDVESMMQS